ncbi:MAG: hypothetical protein WD064_03025 [Acidimicrobiia bacterium]
MAKKAPTKLCVECHKPADTRAHLGHGPQAHPFTTKTIRTNKGGKK